MVWNNPPAILYHGTDNEAAHKIINHGVDRTAGSPLADFGQGFYTTTYLHQAKNWANKRCRRLRNANTPKRVHAAVLQFQVDRNGLATLEGLVFLREDGDYWDFVSHFRQRVGKHRAAGNYDVVFGPVSLWRQSLVIKDCDQISFHTDSAVAVLSSTTIPYEASPPKPFFKIR